MTETTQTCIAIVGGTGKEGRGMAIRWARSGHDVVIGSRDGQRAQEKAAELSALGHGTVRGGQNGWAVQQAQVVLLSVPYAAHGSTITGLKQDLQGRILIDITVPLQPPNVRTVHLPAGRAAAIEAQAILGPKTRVVAALHHVSSVHLAEPDHEIACDVLACGDDREAVDRVIALIGDLGLAGYDAGPLANAVALESLTPVLLHLNRRYKGKGAGLRLTGL